MADKRKSIEIVVDAKTGKAKKGLARMSTRLRTRRVRPGTSLGAKMKAGLAKIPVGAVAATAALTLLILKAKAAIKAATEFETSLVEWQVRAGATERETIAMGDAVKSLSKEIGGGLPQDYANALRALQDAGLGGTEALKALRRAGMNAVVGNGSLADLTAQVQKLAPTAQQAGIGVGELTASLSVAIDSYGKARTAGSKFNLFLTTMKDESNKALVAKKGLVGAIRDAKFNLDDFASSPEALGFIQRLRDDTGGLEDKFQQMYDTTGAVNKRLKAELSSVLLEIGQDLLPIVNVGFKTLIAILQAFSHDDETRDAFAEYGIRLKTQEQVAAPRNMQRFKGS